MGGDTQGLVAFRHPPGAVQGRRVHHDVRMLRGGCVIPSASCGSGACAPGVVSDPRGHKAPYAAFGLRRQHDEGDAPMDLRQRAGVPGRTSGGRNRGVPRTFPGAGRGRAFPGVPRGPPRTLRHSARQSRDHAVAGADPAQPTTPSAPSPERIRCRERSGCWPSDGARLGATGRSRRRTESWGWLGPRRMRWNRRRPSLRSRRAPRNLHHRTGSHAAAVLGPARTSPDHPSSGSNAVTGRAADLP